jgi:hypothetical protein
MSDTPDRLAKRLFEDGEKTRAFFEALQPMEWDQTVYTEGSCWTVRQVLAHFVAAEYSLCRLVRNILEGGPGSPEDFDLNAYNERKVSELQSIPARELVQRFTGLRQATMDLVARIPAEDLARTGRHPFLGVTSVGQIIKLMYRHNQVHIREIRAARSDFGSLIET